MQQSRSKREDSHFKQKHCCFNLKRWRSKQERSPAKPHVCRLKLDDGCSELKWSHLLRIRTVRNVDRRCALAGAGSPQYR
jgi:glutamyl/glutaminyl-tRNA synthetase